MILTVTIPTTLHGLTLLAIANNRAAVYACNDELQPPTLLAEIGTVADHALGLQPPLYFHPVRGRHTLSEGRYLPAFAGAYIVHFTRIP